MNTKNTNFYSFTTIELLVSISMILILTGMFLINYQYQGKFRDLTSANHIILQKIRKTQNMAMSQSKLPTTPLFDCTNGGLYAETPASYGIYFEKGENCFDIFADKDDDNDNKYDNASYLPPSPYIFSCTPGDICVCKDGTDPLSGDPIISECVERVFLPSTIKISDIRISATPYNNGWVNFLIDDLGVKINGKDELSIEIETCIASEDCTSSENTKTVIVNNKGMVEIK